MSSGCGKGEPARRVPLPADVGQAVAGYWPTGAPGAPLDRAVFVRAQAPYRALKPGSVIQGVDVAGRRYGLRAAQSPPARPLGGGPACYEGAAPSRR